MIHRGHPSTYYGRSRADVNERDGDGDEDWRCVRNRLWSRVQVLRLHHMGVHGGGGRHDPRQVRELWGLRLL